MRDDPAVLTLVERARGGDQDAWDRIVERYAPLVWSGCRRYDLFGADADDVGANVWLRLVEHLGSIREPAALPGWLATTTRNECLQLLRDKQRQVPVAAEDLADPGAAGSEDWLLTQERHVALRTAFAALSARCNALLSMLFAEPPTPYAEISGRLGIPVGSIGPTRLRCLDALRAHPLLAALGEFSDHERAESAT
jgi:RNA polymerase sigma factor (sigma-70 family)